MNDCNNNMAIDNADREAIRKKLNSKGVDLKKKILLDEDFKAAMQGISITLHIEEKFPTLDPGKKITYKEYVEEMLNLALTLEKGGIPSNVDIIRKYPSTMFRRFFNMHYGFPMVCIEWIRPLAEFLINKKVLEVGAGGGCVANALKTLGVDIVATDIGNWNDIWKKDYGVVEKLDALEAIDRYGKDVDYILLSWPEYKSDFAYDVLMKMREINPDLIMICIGEGEYGCTANSKFHNAKKVYKDSDFSKVEENYTPWEMIYDFIELYK